MKCLSEFQYVIGEMRRDHGIRLMMFEAFPSAGTKHCGEIRIYFRFDMTIMLL